MHELKMGIKTNQDDNCVRLYLLFLFIVAATILSAVVLAMLYKQFAHVPQLDPSLIIPRYQAGLMLKPRIAKLFQNNNFNIK